MPSLRAAGRSDEERGARGAAGGAARPAVLVLGVGNLLRRDEGVGVRVARELALHHRLPPGVTVVDGGTGGFRLLPLLEGAERLILVDAVDVGAPAGTVLELEPEAIEGPALHASLHEIGPAELLASVEAVTGRPLPTVVVGVQPGDLSPWDATLTEPVAAALPLAVDRVLTVLRRWDLEARQGPLVSPTAPVAAG